MALDRMEPKGKAKRLIKARQGKTDRKVGADIMARSPYGNGGTPRDLAGLNYRATPRAHGLRSANAIYGWYSDKGGRRIHRRPENVNTTTNLVEPVVTDDAAPIRRYVREVSAVVDFDREHRPAYN